MVSAINNLAKVLSHATPTHAINNLALMLEITNMFPPLDYVLYIYHLLQFKKD